MKYLTALLALAFVSVAVAGPGTVKQDPLLFTTGNSDYKLASAARPSGPEVETGDDFVINKAVQITGAKFQGLISSGLTKGVPANQVAATIAKKIKVNVEFYLVFPLLSEETDPERLTSKNPPFPTAKVAARQNSPSDKVLFERVDVTFEVKVLKSSATVPLSLRNAQIKPKPNQKQKLSPWTGTAIELSVKFPSVPFKANAHWFFVPQVDASPGNEFLWLSAPKPIAAKPAFPNPADDLQSWIRNDPGLEPDWERIGTDVVGAGAFNAAFSIYGK